MKFLEILGIHPKYEFFIFLESNSVSLLPRIVDKYRRNLVEPLKNSPRSVSNRAIIEKDRD